ncbi:hypothetical protein PAPYR_3595 [Paratrimastix pyriformis]|uniref:Uncharacterized protein n=1 Tax=Paratrimastix pyriformis TaxID=342808 RepID=A0ABQ8UP40_9EUKA|nr:hypothetical protein PAPYR_3595 [Paratrimastix pyriformis]
MARDPTVVEVLVERVKLVPKLVSTLAAGIARMNSLIKAFTPEIMKQLLPIFHADSYLRIIDLTDTGLNDESLAMMCDKILREQPLYLHKFILRDNMLGKGVLTGFQTPRWEGETTLKHADPSAFARKPAAAAGASIDSSEYPPALPGDGVALLRDLIAQDQVTALDLSGNPLVDEGVSKIVAGVRRSRSIRQLSLFETGLVFANLKGLLRPDEVFIQRWMNQHGPLGGAPGGGPIPMPLMPAPTNLLGGVSLATSLPPPPADAPAPGGLVQPNPIRPGDPMMARLGPHEPSPGEQYTMRRAHKLNAVIPGSQLSWLDLGRNSINDMAFASLAEGLRLTTALQFLGLRCTFVNDKKMVRLADVLRTQTTLRRLDISENIFEKPGATALREALKVNKTLSEISAKVSSMGAMSSLVRAARDAQKGRPFKGRTIDCLIYDEVGCISPLKYSSCCGICWVGIAALLVSAGLNTADIVTDAMVLVQYVQNAQWPFFGLTLGCIVLNMVFSGLIFTYLHRSRSCLRKAIQFLGIGFQMETLEVIWKHRGNWERMEASREENTPSSAVKTKDSGPRERAGASSYDMLRYLSIGESILESLPQTFLSGYVILRGQQFNLTLIVSFVFSLTSLSFALASYLSAAVHEDARDYVRSRKVSTFWELVRGTVYIFFGTAVSMFRFALTTVVYGGPLMVGFLFAELGFWLLYYLAAVAPVPDRKKHGCMTPLYRAVILSAFSFGAHADLLFTTARGREQYRLWLRRCGCACCCPTKRVCIRRCTTLSTRTANFLADMLVMAFRDFLIWEGILSATYRNNLAVVATCLAAMICDFGCTLGRLCFERLNDPEDSLAAEQTTQFDRDMRMMGTITARAMGARPARARVPLPSEMLSPPPAHPPPPAGIPPGLLHLERPLSAEFPGQALSPGALLSPPPPGCDPTSPTMGLRSPPTNTNTATMPLGSPTMAGSPTMPLPVVAVGSPSAIFSPLVPRRSPPIPMPLSIPDQPATSTAPLLAAAAAAAATTPPATTPTQPDLRLDVPPTPRAAAAAVAANALAAAATALSVLASAPPQPPAQPPAPAPCPPLTSSTPAPPGPAPYPTVLMRMRPSKLFETVSSPAPSPIAAELSAQQTPAAPTQAPAPAPVAPTPGAVSTNPFDPPPPPPPRMEAPSLAASTNPFDEPRRPLLPLPRHSFTSPGSPLPPPPPPPPPPIPAPPAALCPPANTIPPPPPLRPELLFVHRPVQIGRPRAAPVAPSPIVEGMAEDPAGVGFTMRAHRAPNRPTVLGFTSLAWQPWDEHAPDGGLIPMAMAPPQLVPPRHHHHHKKKQ